MSIQSDKADLFRRFRFYGFGFLLGMLAVSIIYKGKSCRMPNSIKLEELSKQQLQLSKHGACRMECRGITEEEIKTVLQSGKINYDKSNVHDKPCGTYAVEGSTADGKQVHIVIADCDSISKVVTVIDLKLQNDTCKCN